MRGFPEPGAVWRSNGGGFSEYVKFGPDQKSPGAFEFDSSGNIIVGGSAGNPGENTWIRRYNSMGSVVADIDVPPASSFLGGETPAGFGFTSKGDAYTATWDGRLIAISNSSLNLIAQVPSGWGLDTGFGFVESFAIDASDHFFLGLNLGQRFGLNSGAILRFSPTNRVDILALGIGDIPIDMTFGPDNTLIVGSFNPYEGNKVFKFSGDFAGQITSPVPEPGSIGLLGIGILGLIIKTHGLRKQELTNPVLPSSQKSSGRTV